MHFLHELKYIIPLLLISVGQPLVSLGQETILLQEAIQRAVQNDPRLALNSALAEASDGQIEQASQRPNPTISAEVENLLGTGSLSGTQGMEITLSIKQVIETAGKREKRTDLVRSQRRLIDWESEITRAEIESEVTSAFVGILLSQDLVDLRRDQLALALSSAEETSRLVEAARSSKVEQSRAELAVIQQRFALQKAEQELTASKANLASLWGSPEDLGFEVIGEIVVDAEIPSFSSLSSELLHSAAFTRFSALKDTREAALDLEEARARGDIELVAGGRYLNEDNGAAGFILGVDIPWPLFDKNQGNIRSAYAQLRAVDLMRETTHRELLTQLNKAYQEILSAQAEIALIQQDLLPVAEVTLQETEEGYERGHFNQLAVLESRRVLFEVRESYLDALQRYVRAQNAIEALTRPATLHP